MYNWSKWTGLTHDQPRPIAAAVRQPEPAPKMVQELEQEIPDMSRIDPN